MSFTKGAFFNNANSFNHTAVLKGMLHVNNTTYISKGMVQLFKEYLIFCLDIVPAKTHCIAPKEDYSYSEGYVCFEYSEGCCNYVDDI